MTILISSHELGEIDGVATHVAFLDEGKLLFRESMSDLMGRFREVHVVLDGEAQAAKARRGGLDPGAHRGQYAHVCRPPLRSTQPQ